MILRRTAFPSLLFAASVSLCCPLLLIGQNFGDKAQLQIYRPPQVLLVGRTLLVKSDEGMPFNNRPALEQAIYQALSEFTPATAAADIILTFTVSGHGPATIGTRSNTEKRLMKVGERLEERNVPVRYWEGRGSLSVKVSVRDKTQTLIDNQQEFRAGYMKMFQTHVNGVAEVRDVTPGAQQGFLEGLRQALSSSSSNMVTPTPQEIETMLIRSLAQQIRNRYTKTSFSIETPLTEPKPLKPGNALAQSGQWERALDAWASATLDNKRDRGEKEYNMAVANEALFYERYNATGDPRDFDPFFQEAKRLFNLAYSKASGNKNYRAAIERLQNTEADFTRAKGQWEENQRRVDATRLDAFRDMIRKRFHDGPAEPSPDLIDALLKDGQRTYGLPPATVAAILDEAVGQVRKEIEERNRIDADAARPDMPEEVEFRRRVRLDLRDLPGEPGSDTHERLVQLGAREFRLRPAQADRVVKMEITRSTAATKYKQAFLKYMQTGRVIDSEERLVLDDQARRSGLGSDDQTEIEQRAKADLAAARPAPAQKRPAKPASPAPVQAAKPASPQPQAPSDAQTKKPEAVRPPSTVIKK